MLSELLRVTGFVSFASSVGKESFVNHIFLLQSNGLNLSVKVDL